MNPCHVKEAFIVKAKAISITLRLATQDIIVPMDLGLQDQLMGLWEASVRLAITAQCKLRYLQLVLQELIPIVQVRFTSFNFFLFLP